MRQLIGDELIEPKLEHSSFGKNYFSMAFDDNDAERNVARGLVTDFINIRVVNVVMDIIIENCPKFGHSTEVKINVSCLL
jgi:hypothetical protein